MEYYSFAKITFRPQKVLYNHANRMYIFQKFSRGYTSGPPVTSVFYIREKWAFSRVYVHQRK